MRLCVLASHAGTTLQAIIDACGTALDATIGLVISNNSTSGAVSRAQTAGIAAAHLSSQTHPQPEDLDAAICSAISHVNADVVVLAGYMKKLGPLTLSTFSGRILNTHPSLLPAFGGHGMFGMNVHRAVIAANVTSSGASVHLVEADYDTGPVIAQSVVAVHSTDTPESLAERVQAAERALLVNVLRQLTSGALPLPYLGR